MKFELPHEKLIEPKKLATEIDQALGKEIDFVLLDTQRTQTVKDDQGREAIDYLGFKFDLAGELTEEEIQKINQTIEAHTPTVIEEPAPEAKISTDLLSEILARLGKLEETVNRKTK